MPSLGKIAIIGSGAVGSYYGARLAKSGNDVHFLLRSDYKTIQSNGLTIDSCHGSFSLPPSELNIYRQSSDIGPVDLIIIAWKTTANGFLADVIKPLLHANTSILTLQNGLGNCRQLFSLFPHQPIYSGLCFVCINRLRPGHISHTASGLIRLGRYQNKGTPEDFETIVREFKQSGIKAEAVTNLEHAQWMKLIWNIPFNGLAITEGGVDTEVLLKEKGLENEVRALMKEVALIAKALGHHIPDSFIDHQIERTFPMGPYRPSSMIDFVEGRPVELEAIWKLPLKTAKNLNVSTPHLLQLVDKLSLILDHRNS